MDQQNTEVTKVANGFTYIFPQGEPERTSYQCEECGHKGYWVGYMGMNMQGNVGCMALPGPQKPHRMIPCKKKAN